MAEKPELIALFRLEFYKKQKNWKLCQDVKGKTTPNTPEEEKTKHVLNETYNIDMKPEPESEVEPEVEPAGGGEGDQREEPHQSELNQAFCDETDMNTRDCPPPTISSQIWYNSAHVQAEQTLNWDQQIYPESDKFQDNMWNDVQGCYESQYMAQAQASTELGYNASGCGWPAHAHAHALTQLWRDRHLADMHYSEVMPQVVDLESNWQEQYSLGVGGGGETPNQSWLEHRYWPTSATTFHTSYSEASLESLSEFLRGAAAVPHSSEVDLLAAEETHKRTSLMWEGCNEYPTRDIEPSLEIHEFVAGSFMNVAEGRGRGRLRAERERVVRIGMGRPYRL